jgi:DNA-directed RNA polymerase specialized sigma24 family protein
MTRTYQHWKRVRRYGNPMGWSYRVGLNWGRSRRREQRREVPLAGPGPVVFDEPSIDRHLGDALTNLPIKQRAVVVLRYYLDWPVADIAGALGIPTGNVKSRLHRALASLQSDLGDS